MRVTIVDGHPDPQSFCRALADRYEAGLAAARCEVRRLDLRALHFDPLLRAGYRERQELEPDLLRAQQDIGWCQHLALVTPVWWGSTPALLKGFLDRCFLPGWAFRYHDGDPFWDRLLAGRSARLIVTSDAPTLFNLLAYRNSPVVALRKMVLGFCGFRPVRVTAFGGIRRSDAERRARMLERVEALGRRAR
ncbi:MAG: NAD(P)H-dependent oxidoreductase [Planctomycetes bacterium]|nr:NAD(P)H-dependent oxidoreductase [Planctomycetota bacterium]